MQKHSIFPGMLTNIPSLPPKCTLSFLFLTTFVQPFFQLSQNLLFFKGYVRSIWFPFRYANKTFCQSMFFYYQRLKRDLHQISVLNFMSHSFTFCSIHCIRSPSSERKPERIFRMQVKRGCERALLN